MPFGEISENLARVTERIDRATRRAGRSADDVTLIAVSKTHSAEMIQSMYEAGLKHFGENRLQEWEAKRAPLLDFDATWHMIGHVQSNKAARVAKLFHSVDTVDSVSVAERLEKALGTASADETRNAGTSEVQEDDVRDKDVRRLRILIEVKLDPEAAKSGVRSDAGTDDLWRIVTATLEMNHLNLRGLMGVPPYFDEPEKVRPYFQRLRELRDAMRNRMGREILPVLSMGMSHDFEIAIEEGATEIRVGSALFGDRAKV